MQVVEIAVDMFDVRVIDDISVLLYICMTAHMENVSSTPTSLYIGISSTICSVDL